MRNRKGEDKRKNEKREGKKKIKGKENANSATV